MASMPSLESILEAERRLSNQLEVLQRRLDTERRRNGGQARAHRLRPKATAASPKPPDPQASGPNSVGLASPSVRRVISVSMRLPEDDDGTRRCAELNPPGLPPISMSVLERSSGTPMVYIGWASESEQDGNYEDGWRRRADPLDSDGQQRIPVTIPEDLLLDYQAFCQETLWNLLHYDIDYVGCVGETQPAHWEAYYQVNMRFAEAVTEVFQDGDLIWVHDYHLMLLPKMIRQRLWFARIGFFLYTPFPSSEIFRILPRRVELLQGMLWANRVGFYTYDYSKQFLASCLRLLGLEGSPKGVEVEPRGGHVCEIGIYPAGIDVQELKGLVSSAPVKARITNLRKKYAGRRVIVGVERLDDCFAGITHKLLAFEEFLSRNTEMQHEVVLIQVAMDPRTPGAKQVSSNNVNYNFLKKQVNEFVGRINSIHGSAASSPVHFVTAELDKLDLYALMCVGEVCIVSSVRAGMNLVPYEWTVCQHGGTNGPLILSEFAGAAQSFSTALHVNPWDTDAVAEAIEQALRMTAKERRSNDEIAYPFVTTHTAKLWGCNFIEDLEMAEPARSRPTLTPPPDTISIVKSLKDSDMKKLLIFAYDGTMVTYQPLAELAAPPDSVVIALRRLLDNPSILVFLLTSRDRITASQWFERAGLGNRVGLACEHGSFLRWPGEDDWQMLSEIMAVPPHTASWKSAVLPVMRHFAKRTPGAVLEEGEVTATWHYHDADRDFGEWQARDLHKHLESFIVQHLHVEVVSGDEKRRWIKVRPIGAGKAAVLEAILKRSGHQSDFVFCAGDDLMDEELFHMLKDSEKLTSFGFRGSSFTCHVGSGSTNAVFAVDSAPRFCDVLDEIVFSMGEI